VQESHNKGLNEEPGDSHAPIGKKDDRGSEWAEFQTHYPIRETGITPHLYPLPQREKLVLTGQDNPKNVNLYKL